MDWNKLGRWVLLVGSVVLGVLAGLVGLWIFEAKVPAAMQTTVSSAEARVYYLGAGVGLGFVIFGWALLGVAIAGRSAAAKARRELAKK
jgi:protein-S-isoprenylcysteine O-methyltransferase Ste14